MYHQHRGMMPQHRLENPRLTELLEQIKTEFESQGQRSAADGHERDTFFQQALEEMSQIKQRSNTIHDEYERRRDEDSRTIRALQHELSLRGGPQIGHGQQHGGPPQPPPPTIGHGPRDLFGQIMQGSQGGQAPLGAPPPEPTQPQGLPAHLTQGAAMNTGPPQPHQGFGGYPPPQAPSLNGYPGGGPPPINQSPGPGRQRRGPPGLGTPAQSAPQPYPGPASPRSHAVQTPPPGHRQGPLLGAPPNSQPPPMHSQYPPLPDVGNKLWKLHSDELWPTVPAHLKKERQWRDNPNDTWWAIFNPRIQRELDIELEHTLEHTSVVCCVRFSRDGRLIATGCNRLAQIFDSYTGQCIVTLEDPDADKEGDLYIRSVCFSPDGKMLATGAEDRLIRIWDIESRQIRKVLGGHTQDIYSLDWAINGRLIASGSGDKSVRLWDVEAGTERFRHEIEDGVTTVALSHDGRYVAAGSLDRAVRVWDTEHMGELDWLAGPMAHEDSVYSVAFSPNKSELVSGSLDKTIKLWQLSPPSEHGQANGADGPRRSEGKCIRTFEGHADYVLSVSLTAEARWVFSGSKDRGVQFWDPTTGIAHMHLCGHRNSVISVAPSPRDGTFATGSGDTKARIWRILPYRGH